MIELAPGLRIDRYEVVRPIGHGGMALVVEVRHIDLGTRHALKVLQIQAPWLYERLLNEGRIQATLRDRHVCRVTDVIRVGDAPGLVMEIVDGPPLELLLANYQPNLHQIDQLARGILAGVCAAHASGLVHRDLKPANILLEIDDASPDGIVRIVPKVADYGLAKTLGELGAGGKGATRSGVTLGTPCYMAPEQFRNAKRADQRADQFSLGCLLYELVSGIRPFAGETPLEIYESSSIGRFRPVREVAPSVPGRMADSITRALAPNPNDRFPDCSALLGAWCDGTSDGAVAAAWEPEHIALVRSLVARSPLVRSTTSMQAHPVDVPSERLSAAPWPTAVPVSAPLATAGAGERGTISARLASNAGIASLAGLSVLAIAGGVALSVLAAGVAVWLWAIRAPAPVAEAPAPAVRAPAPAAEAPAPAVHAPAPVAVPAVRAPEPVAGAPAPEPLDPPRAAPALPGPVARPEPAPPPTPGDLATVTVRGVERAWLLDDSGAPRKPGELPPGRYTLQVFFEPARATRVLTIDLAPNERKEIQCEVSLRVCR